MAGKRYAILIASGKYPKEPKLHELHCPEQDVIVLGELLAAPELGGFETPLVFTNQPSYEILPEINRLLFHVVNSDDLILIYFSGHGKRNRGNHLHLTTENTQLNILETTSIPAQKLGYLLKHSYSKKKILLLDCCYSGTCDEIFKGGDNEELRQMAEGEEGKGTFVMTASAATETAKQGEKYSIFTKYLLEGIRSGEADKDGWVYMDDLFSYVRRKVLAESAQEPQRYFNGSALAISRSGTESREKLIKEIRAKIYLIGEEHLLDDIVAEAFAVLLRPRKEMTNKEQQFFHLLEQLKHDKINTRLFIAKWTEIRLLVDAERTVTPKQEQPAVVLAKPAPIILPAPKQGYIFRDNITGMELVYIPAGCFMMGSSADYKYHQNDEGPVHEVCVDAFWMGKYPITQEQWRQIVGKIQRGGNYPVDQVSWNDVQDFIAKLNDQSGKNYRLPTEAEWEYACRAGGSGIYDLDAVAWYDKNSGGCSHPVGSNEANVFDLHDMLGNVWEWCADWYDATYYASSPKNNPCGPSSGLYRVFRGGGWKSASKRVRAAHRDRSLPSFRYCDLGFRLLLPDQQDR